MAASTLKHYVYWPQAVNTWFTILTVPASRVLVVSNLLVSSATDGNTYSIGAGAAPANGASTRIVANQILNRGEVYNESGLVLLAGEIVTLNQITGNLDMSIHVFGEEVDA